MSIEVGLLIGGLLGAGGLASVVVAVINLRGSRTEVMEARAASDTGAALMAWDAIVKALQAEVARHSDDLHVIAAELVTCRAENAAMDAQIVALTNRLNRAAITLTQEPPLLDQLGSEQGQVG